jgi:hypothetical protein
MDQVVKGNESPILVARFIEFRTLPIAYRQ